MEVLLLFVIIFLLTLAAASFVSKKISPVPYFPTHKKDIDRIVKLFDLSNEKVIYELGAGDARVLFRAAKIAYEKGLDTQFVAIEMNPVLVVVLNIKRFFHPNKERIKIVLRDLFHYPFRISPELKVVIYTYISPWFLKPLYKRLKEELPSFTLISYFYPLPKPVKIKPRIIKGAHNIYAYRMR